MIATTTVTQTPAENFLARDRVFMYFIGVVVQERWEHEVKDEDTFTEEKKVQAKALVVSYSYITAYDREDHEGHFDLLYFHSVQFVESSRHDCSSSVFRRKGTNISHCCFSIIINTNGPAKSKILRIFLRNSKVKAENSYVQQYLTQPDE